MKQEITPELMEKLLAAQQGEMDAVLLYEKPGVSRRSCRLHKRHGLFWTSLR